MKKFKKFCLVLAGIMALGFVSCAIDFCGMHGLCDFLQLLGFSIVGILADMA